MKGGGTKLEKGGWTLSLRKMAIDVMDKMILRPVTILVSDPRNGNINTFQGIRDKLIRKKYAFLSNWRDDVLKVFTVARESNDPLINDICTELEQFFSKKYSVLEEFSEFKFRDVLSRLLGKKTTEFEEKTEEIISTELNEQKTEENLEIQTPETEKEEENSEIPTNINHKHNYQELTNENSNLNINQELIDNNDDNQEFQEDINTNQEIKREEIHENNFIHEELIPHDSNNIQDTHEYQDDTGFHGAQEEANKEDQ